MKGMRKDLHRQKNHVYLSRPCKNCWTYFWGHRSNVLCVDCREKQKLIELEHKKMRIAELRKMVAQD